jgi:hypothetical protein
LQFSASLRLFAVINELSHPIDIVHIFADSNRPLFATVMLPAKSMSKLLLVIDSRLNGFAVSVLFVVKYNDVSNIVYSHKRTLVLFLLLLLLFLLYKLYQLKNNARNLLKNAQTKARCHGRMDCERPPH